MAVSPAPGSSSSSSSDAEVEALKAQLAEANAQLAASASAPRADAGPVVPADPPIQVDGARKGDVVWCNGRPGVIVDDAGGAGGLVVAFYADAAVRSVLDLTTHHGEPIGVGVYDNAGILVGYTKPV